MITYAKATKWSCRFEDSSSILDARGLVDDLEDDHYRLEGSYWDVGSLDVVPNCNFSCFIQPVITGAIDAPYHK